MGVAVSDASATITAENTWAEVEGVPRGAKIPFFISGNNGSTVSVQVQLGQSGSYYTLETYDADPSPAEYIDAVYAGNYRVGVDTGDYVAGTIDVRILHDQKAGY